MRQPVKTVLLLLGLGTVLATEACRNGGEAQPQAHGGAPPPSAVKVVTVESRPIEQTSEFIATIRSLRSTTIQPEVEGIISNILVKSGDRVQVGTPLVQIDQDRQQAAVRSTEANRAGVEADVQYWTQQLKRLDALVQAGAISRQEFDQAQNSLRTAQAQLAALDAQVRQGRVQLQYYRVVAPQAGVVGDIPVRKGDRATNSTVITTIDQIESLEAYIQVPLDRATQLRIGLPVQLLDDQGKVAATNPITFVAPRVDPATQTVLVKSLLRQVPKPVRVQQFVRARIVWHSVEGITVPVTAVTRINGQYFCFVAEPAGQGLVARQKPLQVREIVGNDYVVTSGLKPGDKLIVSGIQKIGEGAPVRAD
jgi:RND family efflux transporter MFP subunit